MSGVSNAGLSLTPPFQPANNLIGTAITRRLNPTSTIALDP
jgi:hypothetical protein